MHPPLFINDAADQLPMR